MARFHWVISASALLAFTCSVVAPPPRKQPEPKPAPDDDPNLNEATLGLEYRSYLEEIVKVLEEDPQFKVILDNATEQEIKSGAVADKLHVVDPSIRSRLDELKRIELERLRRKATEAYELSNGLDREAIKEPLHLEHRNPHTFREEDLRRLVRKTAHDLEELDRKRHEEFKKYEMEKEFNRTRELKKMDKQHREEAEKKHEEEVKTHKQHEKVHHPLSEDQLEEVWEEQDHMDKDSFDPETFFRMHDVDGNEQLDPVETMALFKSELDKLYNSSDADPREREEEMNQMRETTYKEVDTDQDGLISLEEFVASTKHEDYKHDQGWEGIPDREHEFEQKEFDEYAHHREQELGEEDHHDSEEHHDDHPEAHPDQPQLSLPIGNPPQPYHQQQQHGQPQQQQQQQQQQHGQPQQQQQQQLYAGQQQGIPLQQQGVPVQQHQGTYQQGVPVQHGVPVQQQYGAPPQQHGAPVPQQAVPGQQQKFHKQ
ncbi:Nucleobindin-2 [Amphibalanus amphitrite]|uniref:Nucleobindin-2 n=1 Tax=Amphibalanus amphitrite TaxID=1232801 RepID=A0A6A4VAL5_AMPAM|nr:Nucleobindin-2 [Amphibalanus amphitrite]